MDAVRLAFADGVYAFRLLAGEIREIEDKCDAGPMEIYRRLLSGSWRFADITETLRLALMSGGKGWPGATLNDLGELEGGTGEVNVDPTLALKLVNRYVVTYGAPTFDLDEPGSAGPIPWAAAAVLAAGVWQAGLMGRSREELGKKPLGETADPSLSPTGESDGRPSSPPSPIGE